MKLLNQFCSLEEGETLLWQGRPAPRCYTFRHWKLALIGITLFLVCSFWMFLGYQLVKTDGYSVALLLLTVPLVFLTFMLGPGQLILARLCWNKTFYALTDQRILLQDGLLKSNIRSYPVASLSGWQQKRFGENLASIRLLRGEENSLIFECLEYPQNLTQHLPQNQSGINAGESV